MRLCDGETGVELGREKSRNFLSFDAIKKRAKRRPSRTGLRAPEH
jgi:hypothetical protein